MIKCLPGELNQVFLNLITNASEAIAASGKMADTGLIHVQTERREHNICIHVSDNGIGMDDVTRAHMFEPFFTTKDIGQGLGQGLSVAYDVVVTKHGGSITVNSTRNIGTTITVTLPMVEGSTEQETEHG
jgi:signal transduction histidine kinase